MDEPEPLSPRSRDALATFGAATGAPLSPGERASILRRAAAPRPVPWVLLLAVSAGVSFVAATWAFRAVRVPEVQPIGIVEWKRTGDVVSVRVGQLRVAPKVATTVRTPQLQATVFEAVALFDVTPAGTVLAVEEGEVAWRSRGKTGTVAAGQNVTFAAAPKAVLAVETVAPPVEGCAAGAEACLAKRSEGSGLAAEFALYGLAMAARDRGDFGESARRFGAYATRFPAGTFAPEASIARMVDLLRAGQPEEARAEADAFGRRFPEDPRAADVAQWREEIP